MRALFEVAYRMLFQTQAFILAFLPIALAIYYLSSDNVALRQWVLIGASICFYGWWDARFLPLLIGQISFTWLLAKLHERSERRSALLFGIALNLLSLATFKYLDFIIAILHTITGVDLPHANLILPIGISFFSFQLISYLIDRLRGDAPIYPFRPFALFVLLFPHLIAGPIVRHNELIPQFSENPRNDATWPKIGAGLIIFTIGFAKKVLLADQLSRIVDPLFIQRFSVQSKFRRSVDRHAWLFTPAFPGLFRLHRDGHRYCLIIRPDFAREFSSALCRSRPSRILATMAYFSF